jgi:hypothetical protein
MKKSSPSIHQKNFPIPDDFIVNEASGGSNIEMHVFTEAERSESTSFMHVS